MKRDFYKIISVLFILFIVTVSSIIAQNLSDVGVVINGVKWATRNVDKPGTFAAKPEDAGMLYQWNRITGWNPAEDEITGWERSMSKGNTWEKANDPCPSGWRVPTIFELQNLLDSDKKWMTRNGVNGCLFGTGDNTIFLSAAGGGIDPKGQLFNQGKNGYYWSATIGDIDTTMDSYFMFINNIAQDKSSIGVRSSGYSIRCIAE